MRTSLGRATYRLPWHTTGGLIVGFLYDTRALDTPHTPRVFSRHLHANCRAHHMQSGGGGSTWGLPAWRGLRWCTTSCSQRHRSCPLLAQSRSRRGFLPRCALRSLLATPGRPSTWDGRCQALEVSMHAGGPPRAGVTELHPDTYCRSLSVHAFVVVLTLKQTFGFSPRSIGFCLC